MKRTVITLCYRKIITAQSVKPWEKMIFDDSYLEFRLQVQNYADHLQYPDYGTLLYHVPQAGQLGQRVAPAITGYVQQLNQIVPDILNNLGRRFLQFESFRFELINSHFDQKERHQVAINFFSQPMLWHTTIDSYLLLSQERETREGETYTHLMQLQPFLSIYTLQQREDTL